MFADKRCGSLQAMYTGGCTERNELSQTIIILPKRQKRLIKKKKHLVLNPPLISYLTVHSFLSITFSGTGSIQTKCVLTGLYCTHRPFDIGHERTVVCERHPKSRTTEVAGNRQVNSDT